MPFRDVTHRTLATLNQNIRLEDIVPGALPPARGDAAAPAFPDFHVADEFIRALPFRAVDPDTTPFARQYSAQTVDQAMAFASDQITARSASSSGAREVGLSEGFGEALESFGTYFKKISLTVRADTGLTGSPDEVMEAMTDLAQIAIVRALGEALLVSNPVDDETESGLAGLPYFLNQAPDQDMLYDASRGLLSCLKELIARCRSGGDGLGEKPDMLVTSSQVAFRIVDALEQLGVTPDYQLCALTGRMQLHYCGVPVLEGRVPQPDGTEPVTDIYALTISGKNGVEVLTIGGNEYGVRQHPRTTMAGIDQNADVTSASSGLEVFGVYALSVKDWRGIARLRAVPAAMP